MNLSVVLGVDIAKLKFDVCLVKENQKVKHKVFANTKHGFEQFPSSCSISSLTASSEKPQRKQKRISPDV